MSWPSPILVAVILAVIGAVGAFWMASFAVDWLRIPGQEGEAGYFAVLMGLFGIVAGAVVGLVVSRYAGGAGFGGFARSVGIAAAVLAALIGAGGLLAWMQYDPWPTVAGRFLQLEVEVRVPASVDIGIPAAEPAPGAEAPFFVWLGAHGGDSHRGELGFAAARREGERVIVPGAIPIVSSQRSLYFGLQAGSAGKALFFTVQLPRALDPAQSSWSDWHSFAADPAAAAQIGPDGFAVRYRIGFAPES